LINCKRCGIQIKFDNGICFDINGRPHKINECKTIPNHVWCPEHREIFSQNNPCVHYTQYSYAPGQSEQFFIDLILKNYQKGDWFTRKRYTKKSGDKMKKSVCTKCDIPIHNMTQKQQEIHEKMHVNEEKKQNTITGFFQK